MNASATVQRRAVQVSRLIKYQARAGIVSIWPRESVEDRLGPCAIRVRREFEHRARNVSTEIIAKDIPAGSAVKISGCVLDYGARGASTIRAIGEFGPGPSPTSKANEVVKFKLLGSTLNTVPHAPGGSPVPHPFIAVP